jgi:hypothetical protein
LRQLYCGPVLQCRPTTPPEPVKTASPVATPPHRVLSCNHGHRYYGWSYDDGMFRFFERPVHFAREQAYEGKYVIQTE